ncbi:MAG: HAD-IIB family hydrolase [Microbacteriaceae bacterium]|nr:HAD-IIB family hydrolase [Microbacteriaceae bacterium]
MISDAPANLALVAFDLDDTLAPSKSSMPKEMADALIQLLDKYQVCIISGGQYAQFQKQVLANLGGASLTALEKLHLMPTCGTQYYRFDAEANDWALRYIEPLSQVEKTTAIEALITSAKQLGFWEDNPWGEIIEDRESQITFSALGQEAPIEAKQAWDPDGAKKIKLRDAVAELLPNLEVRAGGTTSIDITAKGIDKAFGIQKLVGVSGASLERMLFFGDKLQPGGNDYPVLELGVSSVEVDGWEETLKKVNELLEA